MKGVGVWTIIIRGCINCSTVSNNTFSGGWNSTNTLSLLSEENFWKILKISLFPFYDWKFWDFCLETEKREIQLQMFYPYSWYYFPFAFFCSFCEKINFHRTKRIVSQILSSSSIHERSMCCFSADGDLILIFDVMDNCSFSWKWWYWIVVSLILWKKDDTYAPWIGNSPWTQPSSCLLVMHNIIKKFPMTLTRTSNIVLDSYLTHFHLVMVYQWCSQCYSSVAFIWSWPFGNDR